MAAEADPPQAADDVVDADAAARASTDPRGDSAVHPLRRPAILAAALILLHACLLGWSAMTNSVTFDEYAHLPAGVSYLHFGEFDICNQSPPLLRAWAAAPVVLARPNVPPFEPYAAMLAKDRHWAYGEAFLRQNFDRYHHLVLLGRLAMIPISCCGAWVVYRWASEIYGGGAALTSCAVYVLCPNFCAHGSLVTTDVGTSVAMLLAAYLWWRYCRCGSWKLLLAAAVAVGVAHLCKFTALLLWPMMLVIALCVAPRAWRRIATGFAVALVTCLLLVNVGYGFKGSGVAVGRYQLQSRAMAALFARLPEATPVPLPRALVLGIDAQKWEFEQRPASFVLGESYRGSKWYYYPVALAFKVPLPTWALLALALARRRWTRDELAILAAAVIFLGGAMLLAGVDIGVRHVLPALPLAFVVIGRAVAGLEVAHGQSIIRRRAVPVLLVLLAAANLSVAPRYLTFFNLLAGGAGRGQFLLNDSNFDWGQGLIDLKKWMAANDVPSVHLGYFGRVDPGVYGIDYHLITETSGEPYIAISSYFLTGMPHRLPSPRGPTGMVQLDFAPQLRTKPRVAVLGGGTIHVFRREDVAQAMSEARAAAGR